MGAGRRGGVGEQGLRHAGSSARGRQGAACSNGPPAPSTQQRALPAPARAPAGINIKADVSMWLACFLGSLCMLGVLHAGYGLAVSLRLLDPRLYR